MGECYVTAGVLGSKTKYGSSRAAFAWGLALDVGSEPCGEGMASTQVVLGTCQVAQKTDATAFWIDPGDTADELVG